MDNKQETDLEAYFKSRQYVQIIEKTSEILLTDPQNIEALRYQSEAYIMCEMYKKAYYSLKQLQKQNIPFESKQRVNQLLLNCYKLIQFEYYYPKNCEEIKRFNQNWYEENLYNQLKQNESINSYEQYISCKENKIFILGPEKEINQIEKYGGIEIWLTYYGGLKDQFHRFPNIQIHKNGTIYLPQQQIHLFLEDREHYDHSSLVPLCELKTAKWRSPQSSNILKIEKDCDVYLSYELIDKETHNTLVKELDKIANKTQDYFVPMYHNLIDPNLTVLPQLNRNKEENNQQMKWTATDFIIEEQEIKQQLRPLMKYLYYRATGQSLSYHIYELIFSFLKKKKIGKAKICSPISNLDPMEHKQLYVAVESIFNAALPILSRLRKPSLLLPGKLQCVMKAQRIYLNPGEEYSGVWHRDGKNEEIVAVILYYYRVSENIKGGDLEFIDKQNQEFFLGGDCGTTQFSYEDAKSYLKKIPHCRVEVKTGTLLVFSNYQLIHRVLKMVYPENQSGDANAPGGQASRDFLAFFVVDQRSPLTSTSQLEIKKNHIIDGNSQEIRKKLFLEQIEPTEKFGVGGYANSTGNGSLALLGWLQKATMKEKDELFSSFTYFYRKINREGLFNIELLNEQPPFNRGLSWAVDEQITESKEQEGKQNDEQ